VVELKALEFGNSLCVVLPEEVIDRLGTSKGTAVFLIEIEGGDYGSRRPIPRSKRKWRRREKS